jgi:methionine-gamma-lyase
MSKQKYVTKAVHAGQHPDHLTGSIAVPTYETSTLLFESTKQGVARFAGCEKGHIYTRLGNPATRALEVNVAELENGEDARACASGMVAINTAVTSMAKKGDHVIATDCLYGGTLNFFGILPSFGIEFAFVDSSNAANVEDRIKDQNRH